MLQDRWVAERMRTLLTKGTLLGKKKLKGKLHPILCAPRAVLRTHFFDSRRKETVALGISDWDF